MTNQHESENLTSDNERSLQTLIRAITLSQGQFSLILLRCNYADLQRRISQRLHQLSPINIHEITLPASVKTLYTSIAEQLGDTQPPALMVFGLENVKDIDTMLTAANRVREEFRINFPFPILLWVNDQILQKFIRLATDLENWSTTIEFENSTHELIAFLQQQTEAIFPGDVILNPQTCWELERAIQDLQSRGEVLTPSLQANLEFVRGLHNYLDDKIDAAIEHYQQSLSFWRQSENLERQGILLAHIALVYDRHSIINQTENQRYWQSAKEYLQQALDIFEQGQCLNLVAHYINKLCEILQNLKVWSELETLAHKSLALQQEYGTPLQVAQAYGFLAEVAVKNLRWNEANQFVQQALQILFSIPDIQPHTYSWYQFILAKAQQGLGDVAAAIHSLETARESSNHQYNPQLYISILEQLRSLYFEQGEYLKAFNFKLEQLQIEQQYGFRAFVGASYLNPQRKVINPYVAQVMEDPSPNLSHQLLQRGEPPQRTGSPARREALNIPPSLTAGLFHSTRRSSLSIS
ncbi:WD-40 repeat-containing protein [Anabaenopsis circularis NIES-21]|uniref:WD-40 repeat-containing protein n=1 Tax=Anabaenopsis circularis NIES-21 TaxID=1085406 RepID=A0A1Z4G9X9_9CYAN|nr:WD-40 repeat-containing protein [Anabaenopsis circularis NIES-21]